MLWPHPCWGPTWDPLFPGMYMEEAESLHLPIWLSLEQASLGDPPGPILLESHMQQSGYWASLNFIHPILEYWAWCSLN